MIRGKYYIDKRCTNTDGSKHVLKSNEKKGSLLKDQSSKIR